MAKIEVMEYVGVVWAFQTPIQYPIEGQIGIEVADPGDYVISLPGDDMAVLKKDLFEKLFTASEE